MNLNETLCYISKELESNALQFDQKNLEILRECFKIMEQSVKVLESKTTTMLDPFNNTDAEIVNTALLILVSVLLDRTLSSNLIQFIVAFSQFAFNWNKNTAKLESIDLLARFIYQHVASVEQIKSTITTLRKATTAYQDLRNWMPPAFDVSKNYFDNLITNL